MMLWKCCTQYVSKFGKLSREHMTGKGQFSFQSPRRTMPKYVQPTAHLFSFHMLARLCTESFNLGFNSRWSENFQMFKLDLEKAKKPEIKLPTSIGSWKKRVPEKHLFLLYWLPQSLCVDHNKLWKILKEMRISDNLTCFLRNLYAGQKATVRTGHETTDWFQIGKGIHQGCILSPCLLPYMKSTSWEMLSWTT